MEVKAEGGHNSCYWQIYSALQFRVEVKIFQKKLLQALHSFPVSLSHTSFFSHVSRMWLLVTSQMESMLAAGYLSFINIVEELISV